MYYIICNNFWLASYKRPRKVCQIDLQEVLDICWRTNLGNSGVKEKLLTKSRHFYSKKRIIFIYRIITLFIIPPWLIIIRKRSMLLYPI